MFRGNRDPGTIRQTGTRFSNKKPRNRPNTRRGGTATELQPRKVRNTWRSEATTKTNLTQRRGDTETQRSRKFTGPVGFFLFMLEVRVLSTSHSSLCVLASLRLCVLWLIVLVLQTNRRGLRRFCERVVRKQRFFVFFVPFVVEKIGSTLFCLQSKKTASASVDPARESLQNGLFPMFHLSRSGYSVEATSYQ